MITLTRVSGVGERAGKENPFHSQLSPVEDYVMALEPLSDCQIWHERSMGIMVSAEGTTPDAAEKAAEEKADLEATDEAIRDHAGLRCPPGRCPDVDSTIDKLKVTTKVHRNRTKKTSDVHVHIHTHVHVPPSPTFKGYDFDYDYDYDYVEFTAFATATWSYKARCIGGKTASDG